MIRRLFTPPLFESDEDNFRAKFINGFACAAIIILVISILIDGLDFRVGSTNFILTGLIGALILSLYLLHQGKISASGLVIVILGWIGLSYQAYLANGVKDVIVIAYIALALFAIIAVNGLTSSIVMIVSIGALWLLAQLEVNGFIQPRVQNPFSFARDLSFVFLTITMLIYFSTANLREAIRRAGKSEEILRSANKELQTLNQNLEAGVKELEHASQRNKKRAGQFEAIAQITHATTSNEELETLLPRLASLISQQFGFYHIGIFLIDENRENAVLRTANSEGGQQMLARNHKLKIGQTGIVGMVSAMGKPRIALDVGDDAAFFDNPDLPNTRSEMALPLRIGDDMIGVLDVQSTESNAFQEDDIEVLSILADQVTIAIQNARSYETSQRLLLEVQEISGAYLQDAWRVLQSDEKSIGYRVAGNEIASLVRPLTSAPVKKAMYDKKTVTQSGETAILAVPIVLHNEVIGIMDVRTIGEHEWDEDEVDIAEAVAERLSLAIETSLLLKSAQRQADMERITTDISVKIGATTQFDSIIRTAAEELSRVLGGSEVLVQIQSQALEKTPEAKQGRVEE